MELLCLCWPQDSLYERRQGGEIEKAGEIPPLKYFLLQTAIQYLIIPKMLRITVCISGCELNDCPTNLKIFGTLYHEFTHIYDDEWFAKKHQISNSDSNTIKKWVYEEIHAEQIRTLYMLGAKSINDIPEVTYDKLMLESGRKPVSFYDYCMENKDIIVNSMNLIKRLSSGGITKINIRFCYQLIDYILYYIGIISIYNRYCTYDLDNIMDLSYIADYLGDGVKRLLEIYCNDNIEDIPKCTIIESGNIRWQIIKYIAEELKIVKDI